MTQKMPKSFLKNNIKNNAVNFFTIFFSFKALCFKTKNYIFLKSFLGRSKKKDKNKCPFFIF